VATKAKSAFASQTILACLGATIAGVVNVASDPAFYTKAGNCADQFGQDKVSELLRNGGKVLIVILPLFGVSGRIKTGGVWTPSFLPGPNKAEVLAEERKKDALESVTQDLLERANHAEVAIQATQQALVPQLEALHRKIDSFSSPTAEVVTNSPEQQRVLDPAWESPV